MWSNGTGGKFMWDFVWREKINIRTWKNEDYCVKFYITTRRCCIENIQQLRLLKFRKNVSKERKMYRLLWKHSHHVRCHVITKSRSIIPGNTQNWRFQTEREMWECVWIGSVWGTGRLLIPILEIKQSSRLFLSSFCCCSCMHPLVYILIISSLHLVRWCWCTSVCSGKGFDTVSPHGSRVMSVYTFLLWQRF